MFGEDMEKRVWCLVFLTHGVLVLVAEMHQNVPSRIFKFIFFGIVNPKPVNFGYEQ